MSTVSKELKDYQATFSRLQATMSMTAGCGARGQYYINAEYESLQKAHAQLSEQEKEKHPLPKKPISQDDGTMGMATGLAMGMAGFYR